MSKRGLLEMNRNVMSSTSRRIVKGSVGAYGPRKRERKKKKCPFAKCSRDIGEVVGGNTDRY